MIAVRAAIGWRLGFAIGAAGRLGMRGTQYVCAPKQRPARSRREVARPTVRAILVILLVDRQIAARDCREAISPIRRVFHFPWAYSTNDGATRSVPLSAPVVPEKMSR